MSQRVSKRAKKRQRTLTEFWGLANAGVLGYITDGLRGTRRAVTAADAYLNKNKKQKMDKWGGLAPTRGTTINMLAQNVSIKRQGSHNVHSIRGNYKKVKVSKSLRAKIKKVITAEAGYGVYKTVRTGALALTNIASGITRHTSNQGGYTAELIAIMPGLDTESGDGRFWMQGMYGQDNSFSQGNEFQYFTPLKLLDAASVMWNNKTLLNDYGQQTRNFTNSVTLATGVPISGNATAPDKKGVDLHVVNSYVTWELKNTSARTMKLEIYHCVPKIKFPEHLPLETFNDAIAALQQDATSAGTFISNKPADATDSLVVSTQLEPKILEPFGTAYKYEKVTLVINSGETLTHYIQGPKNLDINFSKLYDGDTDMGGKMWKRSSLCAMVAIQADMVYGTAGIGGVSGKGAGSYTARGLSAGNILKDVIAIKVKETFKMTMPDDTGFIQRAEIAGDMQTLNMKRDVRAFADFSLLQNASTEYKGPDEQNPGLDVNMGAEY